MAEARKFKWFLEARAGISQWPTGKIFSCRGGFQALVGQQTDLLDKMMILKTIVSNGNTLRGIGHELGEPSADAFDKVLIRESKNQRVKKSLFLEYLNLMRKPGFHKSVDAMMRFSRHVEGQLEENDPLVKILVENRRMMDLKPLSTFYM